MPATANRRRYVSLMALILTIVIGCYGCMTNCKRQISIYLGLYFQKGQTVVLSIDDEVVLTEEFHAEVQRNDLKQIDTYCCSKDSCKVEFVLGNKDTLFFIFPDRTKRLMVGSDIFGNFSVATDEDKRAWIKM